MSYSAYPEIADALPVEANLNELPNFPHSAYEVTVPWTHLEYTLEQHVADYGLNIDPDFQREHVWTPEQRTAYLEYMLLGGELSRVLIFAANDWHGSNLTRYELVDGKQRLDAVRSFLRDEVPAFRRKFSEFKGRLRFTHHCFMWRIVEVRSRADALKLYLALNTGGTPHKPQELGRVMALLVGELLDTTSSAPSKKPKKGASK